MNIDRVIAQFPLLNIQHNGTRLCYLDNAATTQKPRSVIEASKRFYETTNANIHRGTHRLSRLAEAEYEKARQKVQRFINAEHVEEIIFTSGTTEAINLVAASFGEAFLGPGDEIIVSQMEHHSNIVPWQLAARRKKARIVVLPFNDNGELELDALTNKLRDETKMIAVTAVSNVLGTLNPLRRIIALAHQRNIPVFVDGAQAVPHQRVDVQQMDCDFFAFSGHKMYAETGIGVLYGKKQWLEKLPPWQSGGGMISTVTFNNTQFASLPFKFEAGTPHFVGAASMGAAIDFLNSLERDTITSHEKALTDYASQCAAKRDYLIVFGNAKKRAPVFSFNIKGVHHADVAMMLDSLGVAVRAGHLCAQPLMRRFGIKGCVRASLALYNTTEDIDRLFQSLDRVAQSLR